MNHAYRLPTLLALLFIPAIVTAQGEHAAREWVEEIAREKIRVDLSTLSTLPTVGELRAREEKAEEDRRVAFTDGLVSGDNLPESEVHAAINPTDSTNIIISPIRQDLRSGNVAGISCPIYYSNDFGRTWKKSGFLTLPSDPNAVVVGGGDPVLAFDSRGHATMTWITAYVSGDFDSTYWGIYYARSTDGGATWTQGEQNAVILDKGRGIPPQSYLSMGRISDKQWLAVDRWSNDWRDRVYMAYVELGFVTGVSQINVRRYLPESGIFIDQSVPVSTGSFSQVQFASIDVDRDGGVHVSFYGNHQQQGWGLWHSVSRDGGESFSVPTSISPVRFGGRQFGGSAVELITGITEQRMNPVPHLVIDRSDAEGPDLLHVVWTSLGVDQNEGRGFDIYLSTSDDDGSTWTTPIIVNDDDGEFTDQFYSSVTVGPTGVLAIGWYDNREDQQRRRSRYRVAASNDGGRTFHRSVAASSSSTDFGTIGAMNNSFGIGEYNQILATEGYIIPVWADGRSGTGDLDIYIAILSIAELTSDAPMVTERVSTLNGPVITAEIAPNPVAGSVASLSFELNRPSDIVIDIIGVDGSTHTTVAGVARYESGRHSLDIDLSSLPGGVYLCRILDHHGNALASMRVVRM